MCGMTCLHVRKTLFRFTRRTRSQLSSLSSTTPPSDVIPTLLWSTSIRPKRSRHACTSPATASASATSAVWDALVPPSLSMIAAVSAAAASSTSTAKTVAPSRANNTAVALPFPHPDPLEPAPATSATLPSSRIGIAGL
jgi:hypothetical protein